MIYAKYYENNVNIEISEKNENNYNTINNQCFSEYCNGSKY